MSVSFQKICESLTFKQLETLQFFAKAELIRRSDNEKTPECKGVGLKAENKPWGVVLTLPNGQEFTIREIDGKTLEVCSSGSAIAFSTPCSNVIRINQLVM